MKGNEIILPCRKVTSSDRSSTKVVLPSGDLNVTLSSSNRGELDVGAMSSRLILSAKVPGDSDPEPFVAAWRCVMGEVP